MIKKQCRAGGFTLIEVIVAMAVLFVVLTGFMNLQTMAIRTNDANRRFLIAQDVASREIESIKTLGYTGLNTNANLIDAGNCSVTTTTSCSADTDCPAGEFCNAYGYTVSYSALNAANYQFTGVNQTCGAPYAYCVYKGVMVTRSGDLAPYYYTIKLAYNPNYLSNPILGNGNMTIYWMAGTFLKQTSVSFYVD